MTSERWATLPYQSAGSLSCLPLFSYLPGLVGYSPTASNRTDCDFIPNAGGLSYADHVTAYRGPYAGSPILPNPSGVGLQTYFGSYPPTYYLAPNDCQKSTIYHGNHNMSQNTTLNEWAPLASRPKQQLAASYHTAGHPQSLQTFEFGHTFQTFRGINVCGDFRALDAEMRKLKGIWRTGVGIKRRPRKDRKDKIEEQFQDETTHIMFDQELDRSACNEEPSNVHSESSAATLVLEKTREEMFNLDEELDGSACNEESSDVNSESSAATLVLKKTCKEMFNLDQKITTQSSDIPLVSECSIITDQPNEVIQALEEFQKIELLSSPEVTPVHIKPASEDTPDNKAMMTTEIKRPPLEFGSGYRTREFLASKLPILKETPKSKCKVSSTSITKKVTSLRPPKAIAKSSKPVTQPIPFNLVGESVSQKLRSKREQRRHSEGGKP